MDELKEAHLPKATRAFVGAKSYVAGAPSYVDLEPGDYILVGYRTEGSEVVVDMTSQDGQQFPPLVVGTSAGASPLGQRLQQKS